MTPKPTRRHSRQPGSLRRWSSIATWRSPVLLIQGDDDRNVPFSQTVSLASALRKQGVEFEELVFPDEIHGFLLHRSWLAAYKAEADFFQRHLMSPQPANREANIETILEPHSCSYRILALASHSLRAGPRSHHSRRIAD